MIFLKRSFSRRRRRANNPTSRLTRFGASVSGSGFVRTTLARLECALLLDGVSAPVLSSRAVSIYRTFPSRGFILGETCIAILVASKKKQQIFRIRWFLAQRHSISTFLPRRTNSNQQRSSLESFTLQPGTSFHQCMLHRMAGTTVSGLCVKCTKCKQESHEH